MFRTIRQRASRTRAFLFLTLGCQEERLSGGGIPQRGGLLLGYASLSEDEIRSGIRRLAKMML